MTYTLTKVNFFANHQQCLKVRQFLFHAHSHHGDFVFTNNTMWYLLNLFAGTKTYLYVHAHVVTKMAER